MVDGRTPGNNRCSIPAHGRRYGVGKAPNSNLQAPENNQISIFKNHDAGPKHGWTWMGTDFEARGNGGSLTQRPKVGAKGGVTARRDCFHFQEGANS